MSLYGVVPGTEKTRDFQENVWIPYQRTCIILLGVLVRTAERKVTMKRGMIIAVFVAATLPLRAGIVLALNPTPTSFGSFAGGLTLNVLATGTALLNGPSGTIVTN